MFEKELIKTNKNLLAFSAGVDSSALFFILMEKNIDFDIAIVDYNLREQSKIEVQYAKELAKKYKKKLFLKSYDEDKFSEKIARDFRYEFFDELIMEHNYDALITAHQLNDKLEWFLMQLSKGSGLLELMGMQEKTIRKEYIVYKPLLNTSKDDLLKYLNKNNYKFFIDETNSENIYKRNIFRNSFSNVFLKEYEKGIKKSFEYLQNDITSLNTLEKVFDFKELKVLRFRTVDMNIFIRYIDKELKKLGLIISSSTRAEIIKQKSIIVSNKISIDIIDNIVYIAPLSDMVMTKMFKEQCRINKIPKNIRMYLFEVCENDLDSFVKKLDIFKK